MNSRDIHAHGILGGFGFGLVWAAILIAAVDIRLAQFFSFFFIPILVIYFVFRFLQLKEEKFEIYQVITPDTKLVFTVRELTNGIKQIKTKDGIWTNENEVQFSILPMYEEYHHQQYQNATKLSK